MSIHQQTNSIQQPTNEKALLHLTLETVHLSLRKLFRELKDCGPSCRKNVLTHLTELSTELDKIEKKISTEEWAKRKVTRKARRSRSRSRSSHRRPSGHRHSPGSHPSNHRRTKGRKA